MRAYGLPRSLDLENPDVADIRRYGLKSRIGVVPAKSGECRGYNRNPASKAATRRYWKRQARRHPIDLSTED